MYTRILAPIGDSVTSAHAFDEAIKIARGNGAELQPLYVVDLQPIAYDAAATFYPDMREALLEEGRRLGAQAVERMSREGVKGTPHQRSRTDRRRHRATHHALRKGIWRRPRRHGYAWPARPAAPGVGQCRRAFHATSALSCHARVRTQGRKERATLEANLRDDRLISAAPCARQSEVPPGCRADNIIKSHFPYCAASRHAGTNCRSV